MNPTEHAILRAALNLQDGIYRPAPGGYLHLSGRGLAMDRLRWVVRHDREAVPCGAWRVVRPPAWEVSWGRDGIRRVPGVCRWEVRR